MRGKKQKNIFQEHLMPPICSSVMKLSLSWASPQLSNGRKMKGCATTVLFPFKVWAPMMHVTSIPPGYLPELMPLGDNLFKDWIDSLKEHTSLTMSLDDDDPRKMCTSAPKRLFLNVTTLSWLISLIPPYHTGCKKSRIHKPTCHQRSRRWIVPRLRQPKRKHVP